MKTVIGRTLIILGVALAIVSIAQKFAQSQIAADIRQAIPTHHGHASNATTEAGKYKVHRHSESDQRSVDGHGFSGRRTRFSDMSAQERQGSRDQRSVSMLSLVPLIKNLLLISIIVAVVTLVMRRWRNSAHTIAS